MVSKLGDTYYCKSRDTKPVGGISNGQELREIDTGKIYYFDAEGEPGSEWIEWVPASSGGE